MYKSSRVSTASSARPRGLFDWSGDDGLLDISQAAADSPIDATGVDWWSEAIARLGLPESPAMRRAFSDLPDI